MSGSLLRDRSGMALILTLLAVSFLVAVTVRLSASVNQQMQAAANQSTVVRLDAMLLSGLHLARAALLADQKDNEDTSDSRFDRWGTLDSALLSELFFRYAGYHGHGSVRAVTGQCPVLDRERKKRMAKKTKGQEQEEGYGKTPAKPLETFPAP